MSYLISLKSGAEAISWRLTGSVYLTPFLTWKYLIKLIIDHNQSYLLSHHTAEQTLLVH